MMMMMMQVSRQWQIIAEVYSEKCHEMRIAIWLVGLLETGIIAWAIIGVCTSKIVVK